MRTGRPTGGSLILYLRCGSPVIARRMNACISSDEKVEGSDDRVVLWAGPGPWPGVAWALYTITRAGSISASEEEAVDGGWMTAATSGRLCGTGTGEGSVEVTAECDWTGEGSRSRPTVVLLSMSPSYVGESTPSSDSIEGDNVCFKRDRDAGEEARPVRAPGMRCWVATFWRNGDVPERAEEPSSVNGSLSSSELEGGE